MKKILLSIIIPVYNEEKFIKKIFKKIKEIRLKNIRKEIIFINDGSTDKSKLIIEKIIRRDNNTKLINIDKNRGKGEAVNLGIKYSKGDIIIIQDADLEYQPKNYKRLLQPIIESKYKVVYGKRNFLYKKINFLFISQYIANRVINIIFNYLFKTNFQDIETGYKVFNGQLIRKLINNIKSKDFVWEVEITINLIKNHINIKEIIIDYFPRDYQQGKKITIFDFLKTIFFIIKSKFNLR